jgi:hypothetical protein
MVGMIMCGKGAHSESCQSYVLFSFFISQSYVFFYLCRLHMVEIIMCRKEHTKYYRKQYPLYVKMKFIC